MNSLVTSGRGRPENHFATALRRQGEPFASPLASIAVLRFLPPGVGEQCLSMFLSTPRPTFGEWTPAAALWVADVEWRLRASLPGFRLDLAASSCDYSRDFYTSVIRTTEALLEAMEEYRTEFREFAYFLIMSARIEVLDDIAQPEYIGEAYIVGQGRKPSAVSIARWENPKTRRKIVGHIAVDHKRAGWRVYPARVFVAGENEWSDDWQVDGISDNRLRSVAIYAFDAAVDDLLKRERAAGRETAQAGGAR